MTNHYTIVAGPDGEPTVLKKQIEIRGYFYDEVIQMVNLHGWEYAASKICAYCKMYIEDEDENAEFTDYICTCNEDVRESTTLEPPV